LTIFIFTRIYIDHSVLLILYNKISICRKRKFCLRNSTSNIW